jgi:integrase
MKCFVFRPKRRKAGKVVSSPFYSGRYRLAADVKATTVPLQTTDKQVAQEKLKRLVLELEQERQGMIAPRSLREGMQKPLVEQLEEYIAELRRLGRDEQYVDGVQSQILTLARECPWRLLKDVSADTFRTWRQRQTKSPKTLNEYLAAASSCLTWLECQGRIPKNCLRAVEKIANHGEPCFQRRALTREEARRLVALESVRRIVYLTALETGLRRGELEQLEWRDVNLDGPDPFLNVRRSTTKNHKPAPIPIDSELAEELRKIRPAETCPTKRVFAGRIPRMKRFRLDLKAAGIEPVNAAGGRVDFHALRMTFQMFLTLNGASPRVAMELMRHGQMSLTMKTYTDAGLLPTAATIRALPSLVNGAATNTPENTPVSDTKGHSVSSPVARGEIGDGPETLINTGPGRDLTPAVAVCREPLANRGDRIRTCDLLVPNQALYQAKLHPGVRGQRTPLCRGSQEGCPGVRNLLAYHGFYLSPHTP